MQHTSIVAETGGPVPRNGAGPKARLVRKHVLVVEEIELDGGRAVPSTLRRAAAAAVIANPWVGTVTEDLGPAVTRIVPAVADALIARLLQALGGGAAVEAFGKGVLVGLDGEVEHGAAVIHTPHLGDRYRHRVGGSSVIAFAERRAGAGASLLIPMWHKTEATTRSHYQAMELRVPDAPNADEIVVALAAASGPRPFARIGDRRTDPVLAVEGAPA